MGVSRQSLSVLESGRSVPSAALALRLARELGCKVEELFWIDDRQAPLSVELAADDLDAKTAARPNAVRGGRIEKRRSLGPSSARDARVVLASLDGRWVAHRLAFRRFGFIPDGRGRRGVQSRAGRKRSRAGDTAR